jgi:hypothetical protein
MASRISLTAFSSLSCALRHSFTTTLSQTGSKPVGNLLWEVHVKGLEASPLLVKANFKPFQVIKCLPAVGVITTLPSRRIGPCSKHTIRPPVGNHCRTILRIVSAT